MDEASIISLIIVAVVAVFSSITAPLILSRRTERMHREDQLADYQRQDLVARNAEAATASLLAQQTAASDALLAQQVKAAEEARRRGEAAAEITNGKLDIIHELVNSNMSAAMQAELDALITSLAMMREVMDLKRAAGREPTSGAIAAFHATEAKITELQATLADRLETTEIIAAHAADAAAAAASATKAAAETAARRKNPGRER